MNFASLRINSWLVAAGLLTAALGAPAAPATVIKTNYHGWADSYLITNGIAEVVVVPAIGRVMQFGFAGEEGVFWENTNLFGTTLNGTETNWMNFGGDKSWPAPENEWPKFTKSEEWKPPVGFDGLPMIAKAEAGDVYLISQVDPAYGIRIRRRVHLHPRKPVLFVQTTFERLAGEPAKIGVWTVTQFKDPQAIYLPAPPSGLFTTNGYTLINPDRPPGLKNDRGLLWFARNPQSAHKIGSDADAVLWMGEKVACRVDSPRVRKSSYPDNGSSLEVYLNPDPLKYIELETLGPLKLLSPGGAITRVNTYTLHRRAERDAEREARKILLR